MNFKLVVLLIATIAVFSSISYSQQDSLIIKNKKKWIRDTRLTALINSRTAYQFKENEFSKTELIIRPELEVPLSKNLRFFTKLRFYSEFLDELEPKQPDQIEVSDYSKRYMMNDILEFELRDFYFDWKIGKHYITFGKQQIVWGEADGLKILDIVNPINLREFLLDDFDQSRIPLWSVKTDFNLNKIKLQLLWLPDQSYHDIADVNSPFYPEAFFSVPSENINLMQESLRKPNDVIKDSDVGVRLGSFVKGWDFTLNYLYNYDDFPVASSSFSIINNTPTITISPEYKRYHLAGGTFNKAIKNFTLRGELGYSFQKTFNSTDSNIDNGLIKTDQVASVIGLDYYGVSNTTLSGQVFLDYVLEEYPLIGREQLELNTTFLIGRNFRNETINAELIMVQNLNEGDGFIRPKVSWLAKSNLKLTLGGDFIYGKSNRLFGQYKNQTRLVFNIELGI